MALGMAYEGLGLYPEARVELERSVERYRAIDDPNRVSARHELGILLTTLGDLDEAEVMRRKCWSSVARSTATAASRRRRHDIPRHRRR
jgi:uncharacterized protein HemY